MLWKAKIQGSRQQIDRIQGIRHLFKKLFLVSFLTSEAKNTLSADKGRFLGSLSEWIEQLAWVNE